MNCELNNCNDWFPDTEIGLLTMMWHKIVNHTPFEVNGRRYPTTRMDLRE